MATNGKSPLDLVLGVASVGDSSVDPMARFNTPDEVNGILNAWAARGYYQLDTARAYPPHAPGTSEPRLGAVSAGDRFVIDTKIRPGDHTKSNVLRDIDISLDTLKIKQINIELLHSPDRITRFEEACEAMDEAYKAGKFRQWGLSNYTAKEVQQFMDICEKHGYVKPSVYQGQYNAIVRSGEKELFPLLRKYGIKFYAFSPAAGGFFAGNHKSVKRGDRFDVSHLIGAMYTGYFMKPSVMTAVEAAVQVAAKYGIDGHAAALRWTAYHSLLDKRYGDGIVIGASSSEQLNSNVDAIEVGPLPEEVVAAFESVYGQIDAEDEVAYHH